MKLSRFVCLLSLSCMMLLGQAALAADGPPTFDWTGPYVGAHIGYGWGSADTRFSPLPNAAQFRALAPTTLGPDPSGLVGGVHAGYNYQVGRFVMGIEADFSGSGMSGSTTMAPIIRNDGTPAPSGFLSTSQETNWFGTLRPRLGWAVVPNLLVYGTGGLAYGDVSYSANTDFRPNGAAFYPVSISKTKVGWTAGGGIEYALSRNWTIRAEYLFTDLGSESVAANPAIVLPPFQVGYKWDTTINILNLGISYKF